MRRSPKRRIVVEVPATSGNLGPAFDVAGMALTIFNRLEVEVGEDGRLSIEIQGEGKKTLPRNETNIVVQAMRHVFQRTRREWPSLHLRLINRIPLSRGLGSSAAARVAGIVVANELIGRKLSMSEMLAAAIQLEGHPDNVAPALLGGMVLSSMEDDGKVQFAKLKLRRPPQMIALIPEVEVVTAKARAVLPKKIATCDAVFNIGRAALLVAASTSGRDDWLVSALQDRLHQPYREKLMPWLSSCINAAIEAGALGAVLSGAGSSILAMTRSKTNQVGEAMLRSLRRFEVDGIVRNVRISEHGARVKMVNG